MTVTFRHGNLGSASTNITSLVRAPGGNASPWILTEAAEKGAPAMTGFALEDPAAANTLVGLKEFHAEDSTSIDPTLFAGFFDIRNVARAKTRGLLLGVQREWDATLTDLNSLLSDAIIQSGSRPSETDIARINWLLASGYLPLGNAGFIDSSSPTTLPAADYTGRTPADVLAECSNLSNLNYFVRWEQSCTFPDCTSPWALYGSTYVAPVGAGTSSTDVLGGTYNIPLTGNTYNAAGSPYPVTETGAYYAGTCNNGSQFGTGLVVASGPYAVDTRWTVDLNSLGLPRIGYYALDGYDPGSSYYFKPTNEAITIEGSNDNVNWTVVKTVCNVPGTKGPDPDSGSVGACTSQYRYWSLHVTASGNGNLSWGVVFWGFMLWAATNCPGPALGYHAYNWASDASTLTISNVLADYNGSTCFAPAPDDKLIRNPARVYSGVWFEYNGGHVYVTNGTTLANFRRRETRSSDMNCKTAAAATALANAYLTRCATEEDRFTANLHKVPATKVNGMRPGQRIPLKLSHVPGYTSGTYMGIMRRTLTPLGADLYDVQLELANPVLTGLAPGTYLSPSLWSVNIGQIVNPAASPTTGIVGQRVAPTFIANGDGSTVLFTLPSAYIPGSLMVWVDHQLIPYVDITETSPSTGTLTLDFAPAGASSSAAAQAVHASWQSA